MIQASKLKKFLVCVGVSWCQGVIFSTINTYSCYLAQIKKEFPDANNFASGSINSMLFGLTFALSPIAGILSDRIGIQKTCCFGSAIVFIAFLLSSFAKNVLHLFVTFGIILGCGFSLVFTPSLVLLAHYFKKRIGLVNGFVTFFGSCLFTTVMPFVLKFLFSVTNLSTVFRLLCASAVIMFGFAYTTFPTPRSHSVELIETLPEQSKVQESKKVKDKKPFIQRDFYTRDYILWTAAISITNFGFSLVYTFIVPYYLEATGSANGGMVVSILALSAAVGRFSIGAISDTSRLSRVRVQQLCMLFVGVIYATLPHLSDSWVIVAACAFFGFANGGFAVLFGPVCYDIVGRENASQGLGNALFLVSLFSMAGPSSGGKVFDVTSSLDIPLYSASVTAVIGSVILMFVHPKLASSKKNKNSEYTTENTINHFKKDVELNLPQGKDTNESEHIRDCQEKT